MMVILTPSSPAASKAADERRQGRATDRASHGGDLDSALSRARPGV
jgi:hypothetical protein